APVSDARLSPLGADGVLPGQWRIWFPGSVAGRHGGCRIETRLGTRTPAEGGLPPVRRGRRTALVARARRPRCAYPHLRRLAVASVRDEPLSRGDRRPGDPRGGRAVPRGGTTRHRAFGVVFPAA